MKKKVKTKKIQLKGIYTKKELLLISKLIENGLINI
jgi:hypothetical protein